MNHTRIHKSCTRTAALICLLLLVQTPLVAAQDITGEWEITLDYGGRPGYATLILSKNADGTLAGKWGSGELSNVKFQDGKLTFIRKVKLNDNEIEMTFEGTVQGDKLTGTSKNDQFEVPVTGQRLGAALIGKWELTSTSERGTRTSIMTVNGDLSGRYESFGGEIPIKDLTLEGNQVTFAIEMGFGDQTFKLNFKGTLDGNALKGQMTSERGTSEVTGKKLAVAAAPAVAGTWELTTESSQGDTRTNTLKIKDNMTATYTSRDTETPVTDLKIEGNQISFKITRTFNDQQVTMDFKGAVDGKTLKGEMVSARGSRPVTGKKID